MKSVVNHAPQSALGSQARRIRVAQHLTQKELAAVAGISRREVGLFEHNLPVPLDTRRRLLRELWASRASKG